MSRRRTLSMLAAIPLVALAACGGDDDDSGTAAATDAPAQAEEPQATENAPTATPTTGGDEVATIDDTAATDSVDEGATDQASADGDIEIVEMTHGGGVDEELLGSAYLGAAPFQDVAVAEAAGWVSTAETLGCFQDAERGGMGTHWLNESLLDAELDPAYPEALVYELDANGEIAGLVGHEYLVPFEAWTSDEPPSLFGLDLHEHPVLPFWILHAYLWKENPSGMFSDFNPTVRMCPEGVAVFGVDLP